MKYSEFMKLASKQGLTLLRHGGNHDVYICEKTGEKVIVPRHQSEEIKPGLQNKLLKAVGLK